MSERVLRLGFRNTSDRLVSLNVRNAVENPDAAAVNTLMDLIVSSSAFTSSTGDIDEKEYATLITTTEDEITLT